MSRKNHFIFLILPIFMLVFLIPTSPVFCKHNPLLDQTERLAVLGKVWGFLKYYHPVVASGDIDWDQILIETIPAVKAAQDYESFNMEIHNLIRQAGDVSNNYNAGVPARPNQSLFKWLKDRHLFTAEVSKKLTTLQKKHIPTENYWIQAVPNEGNPTFRNEKRYDTPAYPDENYRLLALFRYWNAVKYFYPYKEGMDYDWDDTLTTFIPRLIAAADETAYHITIKEMVCRIKDGHSFCGSPAITSYFGELAAPISLRYIEGKTIVTNRLENILEPADAIRIGDIILKCQGQDIDVFRQSVRQYVEGSNEWALQDNINSYVLRGEGPYIPFTILRNGQTLQVSVKGYTGYEIYLASKDQNATELKWEVLPGNIGFVNMGAVQPEEVDPCMAEMMNTNAIIFDLRNYPWGTMYQFGYYLNPQPVDFASYTVPSLDYPGEFNWEGPIKSSDSENPDYYRGKVVLLFDERTLSHAEWNCMAFQTIPDVTSIGSPTAGADGNVSFIWLPGYIYGYFTGLGIYYPDGTPTQRVGILPDIYIWPTVSGIQTGKDEVLERALQFLETGF